VDRPIVQTIASGPEDEVQRINLATSPDLRIVRVRRPPSRPTEFAEYIAML